MLSEETLEELKCALSVQCHFVIEPISLHKCGHSVCKNCVPKDELKEIKCKICGLISKQDLNEIQGSKGIQKLLKMHMEDIFKILKEETSLKLNDLKENIEEKRGILEVRFNYIREEIDIRVESLVSQVHEMGDKLREKVKESEKEALNSINEETQINEIGLSLKELDENFINKINFNEEYLDNIQNKMKGLNILMNEISNFKIPDFEFSTEIINDENLIGHFTKPENVIKITKEITFDQDSSLLQIALIENNTKLLITDWKRNLLHLLDLDGNILKSINPNNVLKCPSGICVLHDPNEEKIFVGDSVHHKIFVFNSNFDLKFQFGDQNLKIPCHMQIDNEFDKSRLYVSDFKNDKITIWNTSNGSFISQIEIETPNNIIFTHNSLFVSSPVFKHQIQTRNNKVIKIIQGGNCIFEIDKASLEIKRRIIVIGIWYLPSLLNIEPNGNLQIIAYDYINNITKSDTGYLLTIDQNGKVIEKVEFDKQDHAIADVILQNNKIIVCHDNKLKIFD